MQSVGGWTATAYTMLDLQIVPTTSAHNDGRKSVMYTCVIMFINQTVTASTMDAMYIV